MTKQQMIDYMLKLKAELLSGKIGMDQFKEKRKVIFKEVVKSL